MNAVTLHDIPEIRSFKKITQVPALFFVRLQRHCDRHAAVCIIFRPGVSRIACVSFTELRKGKRTDPDFIAAISELRQNIRRKHAGIAACHIHVGISDFHKSEKNVDERQSACFIIDIWVLYVSNKLYFIDEDIIFFGSIDYFFTDISVKFKRVPVLCIRQFVQRE